MMVIDERDGTSRQFRAWLLSSSLTLLSEVGAVAPDVPDGCNRLAPHESVDRSARSESWIHRSGLCL